MRSARSNQPRPPPYPRHRGRMRACTLASCAISYAPSRSSSAAKLSGQPDAGDASVSSLCADRLHASERFAVSTGTLSARASTTNAGAPLARHGGPFARAGGPHLFCELSIWQRSCRGSDYPPHHIRACRTDRCASPARPAPSMGTPAKTSPSSSSTALSRLN